MEQAYSIDYWPYGARWVAFCTAAIMAISVPVVLVLIWPPSLFLIPVCAFMSLFIFALTWFSVSRSRWKNVQFMPDSIILSGNSWKAVVPWSDVTAIHVTTAARLDRPYRFVARLIGTNMRRPLVEIRLIGPIRTALHRRELKTRGFGIIDPFVRRMQIYPDDPEAFVAAASEYLPDSNAT